MSSFSHLKIGVLALQGAVSEHIAQIERCGAKGVTVKTEKDLVGLDGLVLPGGESSAIRKLIQNQHMQQSLQAFAQTKAVFGTCAGMILLAKQLVGGEQSHLALMDIAVQRNAFGRQVNSFQTDIAIKGFDHPFPAVFIRAPYIAQILSQEVESLATYNGHTVLAKQGKWLACAFHPELTNDISVMQLFLTMV